MRRNDEEWMLNIPHDYTEKLIYRTLLDNIVNDIEYKGSKILISNEISG